MWGRNMKQKRGLFQSIFGKLKPVFDSGRFSQYRLLSSWNSQFMKFSGNAWDIATVRSAVDAFARNAAKMQPRHIRKAEGLREDINSELNRLLQFKPNPFMTAYAFYYRIAAQYCVDNNAFIFPVWEKGKLIALYPINASRIELVEDGGELYARMVFATGTTWTCPYDELIHLRRHYKDNDIFGDSNKPILPVLDTANSFNQNMGKFAELISVVRGILKIATGIKDEDLKKRRDEFIKDNLRMENNGSGIVVTDSRFDYMPLKEKEIPIPVGQLEYIRREIYDYIGVNDAIVQNKADPETMDAFYQGALSPFYRQLSQGLTNGIFTEREKAFGNEILCELDRLQFATLTSRVSAAQYLTSIGAASLDQILDIFGLPPIGGEEGQRRVQTLNVVNTQIIDAYQMGRVDKTLDDNNPDDGNTKQNEGDNK